MQSIIVSVVAAILVLGVVVLVHEFGHFIFAKINGVQVIEFAIGMGPAIYKKQGKETLFSIRIIPVGGFCAMLGDEEDEEGNIVEVDKNNSKSLLNKTVLQRVFIFLGGILFNIILSLIASFFVVSFSTHYKTEVETVMPNSAMEKAGVEAGDIIVKVGKRKVNISNDFDFFTMLNTDTTVPLQYERNGVIYDTIVQLSPDEDGRILFGFTRSAVRGIFAKDIIDSETGEIIPLEKVSILETIRVSWYTMTYNVKSVFFGIKSLVTGKAGMKDMAGPIGLGKIIGDTVIEASKYSVGTVVINLLNFIALLSANLAVMNFIPIPGLDGGHLMFIIYEGITGKRFPEKGQTILTLIGFGFVLLLGVFIAFSDIRNIFFK